MNNNQYEDEISLIDLLKVLLKRKKVIVSFFLITNILTLAYIFSLKPVYESRAIVAIGYYDSENLIETGLALKQRMESEYGINEPDYRDLQKYPMPKISSVQANSKNGGFVNISSVASSPEEAQHFLQSEVSKLTQLHAQKYMGIMASRQELLTKHRKLVYTIKKDIDNFGKMIEEKVKTDSAKAVLLKVEQLEYLKQLPELNEQVVEVEFKIKTAQQTRILKPATLDEGPVKPRRRLILIIGFMLAIFGGVFLAFLIEFVVNIRQQLLEDK